MKKIKINMIGPFYPWSWRDELKGIINSIDTEREIEILDPRERFYDYEENIKDEIKDKIVYGDIKAVLSSDIIICYVPEGTKTIGTYMELSWNLLNSNCKVICIAPGNEFVFNSPWMQRYCEVILDNNLNDSDVVKFLSDIIENIEISDNKIDIGILNDILKYRGD